jgi:hypothetical protein
LTQTTDPLPERLVRPQEVVYIHEKLSKERIIELSKDWTLEQDQVLSRVKAEFKEDFPTRKYVAYDYIAAILLRNYPTIFPNILLNKYVLTHRANSKKHHNVIAQVVHHVFLNLIRHSYHESYYLDSCNST